MTKMEAAMSIIEMFHSWRKHNSTYVNESQEATAMAVAALLNGEIDFSQIETKDLL